MVPWLWEAGSRPKTILAVNRKWQAGAEQGRGRICNLSISFQRNNQLNSTVFQNGQFCDQKLPGRITTKTHRRPKTRQKMQCLQGNQLCLPQIQQPTTAIDNRNRHASIGLQPLAAHPPKRPPSPHQVPKNHHPWKKTILVGIAFDSKISHIRFRIESNNIRFDHLKYRISNKMLKATKNNFF